GGLAGDHDEVVAVEGGGVVAGDDLAGTGDREGEVGDVGGQGEHLGGTDERGRVRAGQRHGVVGSGQAGKDGGGQPLPVLEAGLDRRVAVDVGAVGVVVVDGRVPV